MSVSKQKFQELLKTLEGYKIRFKEFHWNTKSIHLHKLCDDIYEEINSFQDNIAENGFYLFQPFALGEFVPNVVSFESIQEGITDLLADVEVYKQHLPTDSASISLLDDFIIKLTRFVYLSEMS